MSEEAKDKDFAEFGSTIEEIFGKHFQRLGKDITDWNIAHWRLLMEVWKKSGTITQTEAKKAISDIKGYSSDSKQRDLIKNLRSANLLYRMDDPNDDRKKILGISEDALPILRAYRDEFNEAVRNRGMYLNSLK